MIKSVDFTFKFVIVGNSAVGKSALLSRFVDNEFNPFFLSTIGVDFRFKTLDIEERKCKVQIWDTAGTPTLTQDNRTLEPLLIPTTTGQT